MIASLDNSNYYVINDTLDTFTIHPMQLKVIWPSSTVRFEYNGDEQCPDYYFIDIATINNDSPTKISLTLNIDYTVVGATNANTTSNTVWEAKIAIKNSNYVLKEGSSYQFWITAKSVDLTWSGTTKQGGTIYMPFVVGGTKPTATYLDVDGNTITVPSANISATAISATTAGVTPGTHRATATSNDSNYSFTSTTYRCDYAIASCYIKGGLYYIRVEDALYIAKNDSSAQGIFIIPGANPTIDGTYIVNTNVSSSERIEIGTGDSLYLPYSGETYEGDTYSQEIYAYDSPGTYCKSLVTIDDYTTLYVGGNLYIGGILNGGGGAYKYNGQTGGNYAQINLNRHAKIITTTASSYIQADGFIVGLYDSSEVTLNYGKLRTPFVVNEHRGGTAFLGIAGGYSAVVSAIFGKVDLGCTPFNRFFMPNVVGNMQINYNASVIGRANLYANDQHNKTDIKLIGNANDNFICLSSSTYSYARVNYDDDTMIMKLDLYGGATINSLSLNLTVYVDLELSTEQVFFPISWHYDISLNANIEKGQTSASYSTNQDIKLLPGAKLMVNEGAILNIDNIAIYDNYNEVEIAKDYIDATNRIASVDVDDTYPQVYPSGSIKGQSIPGGHLVVNGTLIVNEALGGLVQTTNSYATLTVNGATSISSKEVIAADRDSATYHTYTFNFQYYQYESDSQLVKGAATTYTSWNGFWVLSSDINSFNIIYNTNYEQTIATKTYKDIGDSYAIPSEALPQMTRNYYEFGGWYTDEACTVSATGQSLSTGNNYLYAKWTPKNYVLSYEYVYEDNTMSLETLPSSSNFNALSGNITLPTPVSANDYIFAGWYLDSSCSDISKITTTYISATEYVGQNIKLYGKWLKTELKTYYIDFIYQDSSKNGVYSDDLERPITDLTATLPTKSNAEKVLEQFKFVGWYLSSDCTGTQVTTLKADIFTDDKLILYAKWIEKDYSITYKDIDGTVLQTYWFTGETPNTVDISCSNPPSKTGMTFKGWSYNGNIYDSITFSTLSGVQSDVNITATYERLKYNINFTIGTATKISLTYVDPDTNVSTPIEITEDKTISLKYGTTYTVTVQKAISTVSSVKCFVNDIEQSSVTYSASIGTSAVNISSKAYVIISFVKSSSSIYNYTVAGTSYRANSSATFEVGTTITASCSNVWLKTENCTSNSTSTVVTRTASQAWSIVVGNAEATLTFTAS